MHPESPDDNSDQHFADIFVPGLGVRAALGDDDEHAERPPLWSHVRGVYSRTLVVIRRTSGRFSDRARSANLRITVSLQAARSSAKAWSPKFQAQLVHSARGGFQIVRSALQRAGDGLGSSGRRAIGALRSTSTAGLARAKPLAQRSARTFQGAGSRMLRATQDACRQIHTDLRRPLRLPRIPAAVVRKTHAAHSLVDRSAGMARERWRSTHFQVASFKTLARYRPTRPNLRRAAPALAVLLAMVVFVIQEIARAVSR
jgi:hypothetical protein